MLHTAGAGEPHHVYLRRTSARRHFLYGRLKRGRRGSHCRAKAQIPVLSVRVAVESTRRILALARARARAHTHTHTHTHTIPHLHLPSSLALCFSRGLSQTEAAKYQSLVWGTNSLANCIGSFFGGYVLKYACTPARQRYRSTAVACVARYINAQIVFGICAVFPMLMGLAAQLTPEERVCSSSRALARTHAPALSHFSAPLPKATRRPSACLCTAPCEPCLDRSSLALLLSRSPRRSGVLALGDELQARQLCVAARVLQNALDVGSTANDLAASRGRLSHIRHALDGRL